MLVYDCDVTEHADGTIEATPIPESGREPQRARVRPRPVEPREPETFDTTGEPS